MIVVKGRDDFHFEQVEITATQDEGQLVHRATPVHQGQVLDMEVQDLHSGRPTDGISRLNGYVVDIEGAADYVGKNSRSRLLRFFAPMLKAK